MYNIVQIIIGILTIIEGFLVIISGIAPAPGVSTIKLGTFWPDYAGSSLLIRLGVPPSSVEIIAISLALIAGLTLILAGLGFLGIIDFGELIEEFAFIAIVLSLMLFLLFFQPFVIIGIIFNIIIVFYLMFK